MVARFLITTADERTWRFNRPVLFLGEWCRLYDRRSVWGNLDSEVVPYHWDDRSKLFKDYLYLCDLYEQLLVELSAALNQFHEVDHSKRYWRILIGPWLGFFTQALFDRWIMIQNAVQNFDLEGVASVELPYAESVPNDMTDFMDKFLNDPWNSFIYGKILINWFNVSCRKVAVKDPQTSESDITPPLVPSRSLFRRLMSATAKALFCNKLFSRQSDAFFISSYLPLLTDFRLQVLLGQMPKLWLKEQLPKIHPSLSERTRLTLLQQGGNGFEQCVRNLIPQQIPTLYLEGFNKLQDHVKCLPWPKRPKVIFTSNRHYFDDGFKAWVGYKIEKNSRLLLGQHGGGFGSCSWIFVEEHDRQISDRYLTWGWDEEYPKDYPTGILKLMGVRHIKWNEYGDILLVTSVMPRYSYHMFSGIVASQMLGYFDEQYRFTAALPECLRAKLLVRLYPSDYGWSQVSRWRDHFPNIRLDTGTGPIKPLIRKSRLYVATYNGTNFLETLAQNIPTIIFWNPKNWELRPSAKPYYERLKEAGIFHESPESAAAKIAEVWDDVSGWWNQPAIQEARSYFCYRFARMPKKPIKVLVEALTTIGHSNKS